MVSASSIKLFTGPGPCLYFLLNILRVSAYRHTALTASLEHDGTSRSGNKSRLFDYLHDVTSRDKKYKKVAASQHLAEGLSHAGHPVWRTPVHTDPLGPDNEQHFAEISGIRCPLHSEHWTTSLGCNFDCTCGLGHRCQSQMVDAKSDIVSMIPMDDNRRKGLADGDIDVGVCQPTAAGKFGAFILYAFAIGGAIALVLTWCLNSPAAFRPRAQIQGWISGWKVCSPNDFALLALYCVHLIVYYYYLDLLTPCLREFHALFQLPYWETFILFSLGFSCVCALGCVVLAFSLDPFEISINRRCAPHGDTFRVRALHVLSAFNLLVASVAFFLVPWSLDHLALYILSTGSGEFIAQIGVVMLDLLTIRIGKRVEDTRIPETYPGARGSFTATCLCCTHLSLGISGVLAPIAADMSYTLVKRRMDAYDWALPVAMVAAVLIAVPTTPQRSPEEMKELVLSTAASGNELTPRQNVPADDAAAKDTKEVKDVNDVNMASPEPVHLAATQTAVDTPPLNREAKPEVLWNREILMMFCACRFLEDAVIWGGNVFTASVIHELGFTRKFATDLVSAQNVIFYFTRLGFAVTGSSFTPRRVLGTALPLAVICSALNALMLLSSTAMVEGSWAMVVFVINTLIVSVGCGVSMPWIIGLFCSCQRMTGLTLGLSEAASCLGVAFGDQLIGGVYDHFGAQSVIVTIALMHVVAHSGVAYFHYTCMSNVESDKSRK